MLRTHKILSLGLSSLMLFGMAAAANASTETFSATVPSHSVTFSTPFNLALFDPSLGTLTGVTLTFAYSITPTLKVQNTDGTPGDPAESFTGGFATAHLQLTGPDGTTADHVDGATGLSGTVADGSGVQSFPGGTETGNSTTTVLPSNFASYTGAGSFGTFTAKANGISAGGDGGGFNGGTDLFYNGSATAGGTASVTYTYTPASSSTPEPGTWAMMVAGASTGLVALRRRRRNKK